MSKNKGQTSIELAVFGAILIFVIGAIIQAGLNQSFQQDKDLKAMRQAMLISYNESGGGGTDWVPVIYAGTPVVVGGNPVLQPVQKDYNSRNTASVLMVEDRQTAGSDRTSVVSRMPLMSMGSGAHSRNMFTPTENNEDYNLPKMDIVVNGKQFQFTTANFVTWCTSIDQKTDPFHPDPTKPDPDCGQQGNVDGYDHWIGEPQFGGISQRNWDPYCAYYLDAGPCPAVGDPLYDSHCGEKQMSITDPDTGVTVTKTWHQRFVGCASVSALYANVKGNKFWDPSKPPRFDLDRNADPAGVVPPGQRAKFAWQWGQCLAYYPDGAQTKLNTDAGYEPSYYYMKTDVNSQYDIDGDLKLESIMQILPIAPSGVISRIRVLDSQEGDMDMTIAANDVNPKPKCELSREMKTYSWIRPQNGEKGSWAVIEEGKLFARNGDNKQYIRAASRKDEVDVIERKLQMNISNDMRRFCSDGNTPPGPGLVAVPGSGVEKCVRNLRAANPAHDCAAPGACQQCRVWDAASGNYVNGQCVSTGSCDSQENMYKTCLDVGPNILYIRSWLSDQRGRRWVTEVSGDDTVDVKTK
ncbi:MAG: hypothetical protein HQL23_08410 [Candidatus Omnitrophica bacterium]|nr:hypothetical protein [Candidatus Omnitrophota bacterium]